MLCTLKTQCRSNTHKWMLVSWLLLFLLFLCELCYSVKCFILIGCPRRNYFKFKYNFLKFFVSIMPTGKIESFLCLSVYILEFFHPFFVSLSHIQLSTRNEYIQTHKIVSEQERKASHRVLVNRESDFILFIATFSTPCTCSRNFLFLSWFILCTEAL